MLPQAITFFFPSGDDSHVIKPHYEEKLDTLAYLGFDNMIKSTAAAAAKSLQSCPTLCDLIDGSPPGSSVHGIFQARVLEWGATAFSEL